MQQTTTSEPLQPFAILHTQSNACDAGPSEILWMPGANDSAIAMALRKGDRHFADRGLLGLYLGPSEQAPGCVVYVPSLRKFFVSRDVIAYEDVHPGVRHIDAAWPVSEDAPLPPDI